MPNSDAILYKLILWIFLILSFKSCFPTLKLNYYRSNRVSTLTTFGILGAKPYSFLDLRDSAPSSPYVEPPLSRSESFINVDPDRGETNDEIEMIEGRDCDLFHRYTNLEHGHKRKQRRNRKNRGEEKRGSWTWKLLKLGVE